MPADMDRRTTSCRFDCVVTVVVCLLVGGCAVVDEDAESARQPPPVEYLSDAGVLEGPPDASDAARPPAPRDPVLVHRLAAPPPDGDGRVRVEFDVGPDVRAVTLYAEGPEGCLMIWDEIIDGDGNAWVSPAPPDRPIDDEDRASLAFPGPFLSVNRVTWGDAVATAMVPSQPAVSPGPGRWSASIALVPPPPVETPIEIVAQVEYGPPVAEGRVDLHFHFTRASDWRAADVAMDAEFRRMLNTAAVLLRDAGIALGEVTYTDVPVVTRSVSVQRELGRLLRLSTAETGISVFVVGRIEDEVGGPLAGIAGAVPSSAGLPETAANGVAIARDFADGQALGSTLAHEIGHALGLFHTVESNPRYVDQLDDTPTGEDGRLNVMYPTGGDEGRRFSREQGRMMRASRGVEPPL